MKRQILYKEFRNYKVWIALFLIFFIGLILGWFISSFNQVNSCVDDNQQDIQNLCIGWANHKVLERELYSNSFGANFLQQKYWISVYEKCMEDYNGQRNKR